MKETIQQISSYNFGKTKLFFDKTGSGREVTLNLACFPGKDAGMSKEEADALVHVILEAISRMEIAVGNLLGKKEAVFYMWHDRQAKSLKWTLVSAVGQTRLHFSSNVNEVDVKTVVAEWAAPREKQRLLSSKEIEKLTSADLSETVKILLAKGRPTINVFVRKVDSTRQTELPK